MEAFEHELRLSFLDEAKQLLNEVEQCYLQLELNPNDTALIDQIFRVAHNIKGSARAVGFAEVGQFAHEFENLLLKIKKSELEASQTVVDLLLKCNDHLSQMVSALKEDLNATFDSQNLIEKILEALSGQLTETSATSEEELTESVNFEEITNDLTAEVDLADSSSGANSDSSGNFDSLDNSVSLDGSTGLDSSVAPDNTDCFNSDDTDTIDNSGNFDSSDNSVSLDGSTSLDSSVPLQLFTG